MSMVATDTPTSFTWPLSTKYSSTERRDKSFNWLRDLK